ncbi:MAG: protein kinase, partial [Gemmatimonadetes bacterium]|nr:protein kinase [Gemmatimonadota bacterium]
MSGRSVTEEQVFSRALDLDAEERARYLDEACAGNPDLRSRVQTLLDADGRAAGFLAEPVQITDAFSHAAVEEPLVGRDVGGYRLKERIGAGGMSTVYLAERTDPDFAMQAAVKLIHHGPEPEAILRRFLTEREVLAQLRHPAIAQLLDGGLSDDGRPYLVMEYVEGRPLDDFCRERGLSIAERLELIATVCDAVHHAHRNLVVHRDLKPENILVTADGHVKLLDFGIAKVLTEDGPGDAATLTRELLLTPTYASPEQLRGEPVGTASDVYSLGVILFELLTGKRPHGSRDSTPSEIARAVEENDPEPPSRAADVRIDPDLDNITLLALRKEPEQRYASAEHLAADLRRFRDGLPVSARPATIRYRAAKFLRRNAVAVGAAVIVLLAVTGAAVVSTVLLFRADAARVEADRQRESAEEVGAFLQEMLGNADPYLTAEKDVTVREMVDRAAERVSEELGSKPDVAAQVLVRLSETYEHLADLDAARKHAGEAPRLIGGDDSEIRVRALRRLASVFVEAGEPDSALAAAQKALECGVRLWPAGNLETVR